MARIRSIKPDIRRSLVVSSWKYDVRWTFVGLPGYCDDHGRALDDPRLVKAELYPLDDDMTARRVNTHLDTIANNGTGPLCRYKVAGQSYLHLINWAEHQRPSHPSPSRIPPCPHHEGSGEPRETLPNDSGNPPEASGKFPPSRTPAEQGAGSREQVAVPDPGETPENSSSDDPPNPSTKPTAPPPVDPRAVAILDTAGRPMTKLYRRQCVPHIVEGLDLGATRKQLVAAVQRCVDEGHAAGFLPLAIQDAMRRPDDRGDPHAEWAR